MGSLRKEQADGASAGLPATLHLGAVHLTVANLDRSLGFYVEVLGFRVHRRQDNEAYLGVGGEDMLVLTESPGASPRPRDTTGLYHFAILQPDRASLARSLRRLVDQDYPLWGASDHLVSEALYLDDPDGNGIEIYRDRPRDAWRWRDGLVEMDTRRLDLGGLLGEPGAGEPWEGLPGGASIGHVHLHVRDLGEAERLYHGVLGFDVVARYGGQALFVSAGGYHHHVGLNTWAGAGAPPPPDGSAGLRLFEIHLPDPAELEKMALRLRNAGVDFEEQPNAVLLRDHSRNGIYITSEDTAESS